MSKMHGIRGATARTLSSFGCITALLAAAPGAWAAEDPAPREIPPTPPDAPSKDPAPEAKGPRDSSWQMDGEDAAPDGKAEGEPADAGPADAGPADAGPGGDAARPAPGTAGSDSTSAPSVDPVEANTASSAKQGDEGRPRYALPASTEVSIPPAPDPETVPFTHHQLRWDVQLGVRNSWIPGDGFDAFAENDSFTQLSAGVGRGVFRSDRWSVAVHGFWELGSKSATVRGAESRYSAQRFAVSLEGRYHLLHWLYGYGRLAPGATRTVAHLDAPGQSFGYESRTWVVSTDLALGAAARLIGNPDGREPGGRLWFFAEGGYGWSGTQNLLLRPTSGAPERSSSIDLGELGLSGGFGRVGLLLAL